MRENVNESGSVMSGTEVGFALRELGELLSVEVTAARVECRGKVVGVIIVKAEESVGAHGENSSAHIRGQLGPKLLSGYKGDAVFPSFGDERGDVGADQVLEFVGVDGEEFPFVFGEAGLCHDLEGQIGEEEAAEHVGILFTELAFGQVDDDAEALLNGRLERDRAVALGQDVANVRVSKKGGDPGEEGLGDDTLHGRGERIVTSPPVLEDCGVLEGCKKFLTKSPGGEKRGQLEDGEVVEGERVECMVKDLFGAWAKGFRLPTGAENVGEFLGLKVG